MEIQLLQKSSLSDEWFETTLENLIFFKYGKSLPTSTRNGTGKIPVYGSSGIIGYHDESLIDGPAIIIGRKGTIGSVYFSLTPCWPIDTVFYSQPNFEGDLEFSTPN